VQEQISKDFEKIYETFDGMRNKIRKTEKYTEKIAAINKFHQALNVFLQEILPDHAPPPMISKKYDDDWLDCRC
jgi:hypothetical protein